MKARQRTGRWVTGFGDGARDARGRLSLALDPEGDAPRHSIHCGKKRKNSLGCTNEVPFSEVPFLYLLYFFKKKKNASENARNVVPDFDAKRV